MAGKTRGKTAPDLAQGAERFRAWRRVRTAGSRIPEALWALAVQLANRHGVYPTASTLGLDYYSLKKRVAAGDSDSRSAAPAFVELSASSLVGSRECLIELEDGAGTTMRVHLKGYEASDVAAVGRSLWKVS